MALLDQILEENARFVAQLPESYLHRNEKVSKYPARQLAIYTCMDTRLVDFLEPAMGIARGVKPEAIAAVEGEFSKWVDAFHHPRENVEKTVAEIKSNPLLPKDIIVHGLLFCPDSGRLEVIVRG